MRDLLQIFFQNLCFNLKLWRSYCYPQTSNCRKSLIVDLQRHVCKQRVIFTVVIIFIISMHENIDMYLNKSLFVKNKNGLITDEYEIGKELGKGAYGTVFLAKLKDTGNIRAIKQIKRSSVRVPATFTNEIEILKRLDHPNIIKIYETFEDKDNYYVITDVCEGGELFDKLIDVGSFSEHDARDIFKQMVYAIKYCHSQKIAHRDLKPQNFLLLNKDNYSLKLIDFGLSYQWVNDMREQLKEKKENRLIGTSYYISPDILRGDYDQNCDIWSLGVILYILVSAVPPFDGQNDRKILEAVRNGQYTFDIPEMKNVSNSLKDLISKLLKPEKQRLSIEQIYNHPWMNEELEKTDLKLNVSKLVNFSRYSKLKTFAATCIAAQMTGKQIQKIGQLFKQIDTDHDGFITTQQLKKALDNQKQSVGWPDLIQLMHVIDTDHNGKINYTEFVAGLLENTVILREENLYHVFHSLDINGDGKISASQLRSAMFKNSFEIQESVLKEIISSCDKNGDEQIDFKEFLNSIAQL